MEINLNLNGRAVSASVRPDTLLLDFLRDQGCYSVKRGCETSNCGACTVLLDGRPVLSCSVLAARADGRTVQTLTHNSEAYYFAAVASTSFNNTQFTADSMMPSYLLAGQAKLVEALFIATAIALGAGMVLSLHRLFF